MKTIRLFISSPGDVALERARAERVIQKLQIEFGGRVKLDPFIWEHEPMRATASFSDPQNIPLTSEFDIVICILWSRLGTMLSDRFRRPDGSRYPSGTVFELETAKDSYLRTKAPDLLVYRRDSEIAISNNDAKARLEKLHQLELLDGFIQEWFFDKDDTFRSALNTYKSVTQFETLLERHLRRLIELRLETTQDEMAGRTVDRAVDFASFHAGNPFKGLEPFEFEDRKLFFGRSQAIEQALDLLRNQTVQGKPALLVHGMSGCGKSSLVRAGILPMMTEPGVIDGMAAWRRAEVRMGESGTGPLEALAAALVSTDSLPELPALGHTTEKLVDFMRTGNDGRLVAAVLEALQQAARSVQDAEGLPAPPKCGLVLFIDQLEALFSDSRHADDPLRKALEKALVALVRSGSVWLLLTMRSDQLDRLGKLDELSSMLGDAGTMVLNPPTETDLSLMIRLPARAAGLSFEQNRLGEGLEDRILKEARHAPDGLPLVGFVLQTLYERKPAGSMLLTHEGLDQLQGLEGAVGTHAEDSFRHFVAATGDEQAAQAALGVVMRALTTLSENPADAPLRRVAELEPLRRSSGLAGQLVDALIAARLVTSGRSASGSPTVHVSHEALFRKWPRLAEAIEKDRRLLSTRQRAEAAANLWRSRNHGREHLWDRGTLLGDARFLATRSADLDATTLEFVRTSIRAASRKRIVFAAVALAMAAAIPAALHFKQPEVVATELSDEEKAQLAKLEQERLLDDLDRQLQSALPRLRQPEEATQSEGGIDPGQGPIRKGGGFPDLEVGEICRRIREIDPKHPGLYAAEVEAEILTAERLEGDEADALYSKLEGKLARWIEEGQPPDELLNLKGRIAHQRGDLATAAILWSDYLRSEGLGDETKSDMYVRVSTILRDLGKWSEFRSLLDEWITWRDHPLARVRRAALALDEMRLDAAGTDFNKATELAPENEEVVAFGPRLERVMRYRGKIEEIDKMISGASNDEIPEMRLSRAVVLLMAGQPKAASSDLELAAAGIPYRSCFITILRGIVKYQQGQNLPADGDVPADYRWRGDERVFVTWLESAMPDFIELFNFDKGLGAEPSKNQLRYDRAWLLWRIGYNKMAMRDAMELERREPRNPHIMMLTAACHLSLNEAQDSLDLVTEAIALDPGIAGLHRFQAEAMLRLGRNETALEAIDRALSLAPDVSYFWTVKSNILHALKRGDEARQASERAASLRN